MYNAQPELLRKDLCDKCVAQAVVEVQLQSGFWLMFCNHHYGEVKDQIVAPRTVLHQLQGVFV